MTRRRADWAIGIYTGETPLALSPPRDIRNPVLTAASVTDFPACFVADPFMVWHDSEWHLFFEAMNRDTGQGEIALATSHDGFAWQYQESVLREPFHLSYPHVYRWGSDFYMVPERGSTGTVTAYRAERFPFDWRPIAELQRGIFADPTIFTYDACWWMYACTNPQAHDELSLYMAADPLGPWTAHPCSPLLTGSPSIARPAGKVLNTDSGPLRFAQDCVPMYGTCVRAVRVEEITCAAYREQEVPESPVLSAGSTWNATGMHHIDAHQLADKRWIACVDGYRLD